MEDCNYVAVIATSCCVAILVTTWFFIWKHIENHTKIVRTVVETYYPKSKDDFRLQHINIALVKYQTYRFGSLKLTKYEIEKCGDYRVKQQLFEYGLSSN